MFTKAFLLTAIDRAVSAVAYTLTALLGTDALGWASSPDLAQNLKIAGVTGLLSIVRDFVQTARGKGLAIDTPEDIDALIAEAAKVVAPAPAKVVKPKVAPKAKAAKAKKSE